MAAGEDAELVGGISVSLGASDAKLVGDLEAAERLVQNWASQEHTVILRARAVGGTAGGGGGIATAGASQVDVQRMVTSGLVAVMRSPALPTLIQRIDRMRPTQVTPQAAPIQRAGRAAPPAFAMGPSVSTRVAAEQSQSSLTRAINEQLAREGRGEQVDSEGNIIQATRQRRAAETPPARPTVETPQPIEAVAPTVNVDFGGLQAAVKELEAALGGLTGSLTRAAESTAATPPTGGGAQRGRPRRGAQARAAAAAPAGEDEEFDPYAIQMRPQPRSATGGAYSEIARNEAGVERRRTSNGQRAFAAQEARRTRELSSQRAAYADLEDLATKYFDAQEKRAGKLEDQESLFALSAEQQRLNNAPPTPPNPAVYPARTAANETPEDRARRERSARDQNFAAEANAPRQRRRPAPEVSAVQAAQARQEQIFTATRARIVSPEEREQRIQEAIEQGRANVAAGTSTGRTSASRIASVLGGTGGRRLEADVRAAAARRELNAANRAALPFERELATIDEDIANSTPRVAAGLRETRAAFRSDPATVAAFKRQETAIKGVADATKEYEKLQSGGNIVRNLSAIAIGSFAFSAALKAVDVAVSALAPSVGAFIDQQVGFVATSTRVTSALAAQTLAAHGNVEATLAQSEAQAGLSKQASDFINTQIKLTTQVKAGALAQQAASDLFRAGYGAGQGAPQGLYGGFGGVGGSGLLAQQLGGGKGFTEQLLGDISALRNPKPQGPDLLGGLQQGLAYVTNPDIHDLMNEQGKSNGNQLPDIVGTIGRTNPITGPLNSVLDIVGGAGDQLFRGGNAPPAPPTAAEAAAKAPTPELTAYLKDLNSAAERGASALGQTVHATYELTGSQEEIKAAMAAAAAEGDQFGVAMARLGVVIKDTSGRVSDAAGRRQTNEQAAVGRGRTPPDVLAAQFNVADEAMVRALGRTQDYALKTQLPAQAALQNLAQPLLPVGTGIPGGAATGGQQKAVDLQKEINAYAAQGRVEIENTYKPAIIAAWGQAAGQAFQSQIDGIAKLGTEIAGLQAAMSNEQVVQQTKQYDYQLFIARRTLSDIGGLTGRNFGAGQSYLGVLEKQNLALSRQGQQLGFNLSQRQINFQTAVAGFQTPGVTPEERQARIAEAKIEASYAQKQLDIQKQMFGNQVKIVDISNLRQGADLAKQIALLVSGRQVTINIAVRQQELIKAQQRSEQLVAQAGKYLGSVDTIAAAGISHINDLEVAAGRALTRTETKAVKLVSKFMADLAVVYSNFFSNNMENPTGGNAGSGQANQPGTHASGVLGSTSGATSMIVGEAGTETVAVLRNPRAMMAGMGGGSTVNFYGGVVVRQDSDIVAIARQVTKAMGRDAALKGLRSQG